MMAFFSEISARLQQVFSPETLAEKIGQGLVNLVVGLSVLVAFYVGWQVLRIILRPSLRRSRADETTIMFLETLIKYGLIVVGAITALDSAGLQMSAVLASLGIAGLTIGFAARDALSNIISGILIFLDRPFVIGDLVEMESLYGKVDRITLRSTRIVTGDGKMLAVPNTEVINKTVASYTNFPHLRLDIPVSIAVTENLDRVRRLLLGLAKEHTEYLGDPTPRVVVTELNDYNVTLELQIWLDNERQHVEKRFELRESVYKTLTLAGVDMPFETFNVTPLEVRSVVNG